MIIPVRISSPGVIHDMGRTATTRGRELARSGPGLEVVLGLGGNLGEPRRALQDALPALAEAGAEPLLVSRLYRSAPIGPEQPEFLNAAVLIRWPLDLTVLLRRLQSIESDFGRVRGERWGPRTLDLDILLAGGQVIRSPELVVPHPELRNRAFALLPLLDVAPTATCPESGVPYRDALTALSGQQVERVFDATWPEALPVD